MSNVTQTIVYEPKLRDWYVVSWREKGLTRLQSSYHVRYIEAKQEADSMYIVPGLSDVKIVHVEVRDE